MAKKESRAAYMRDYRARKKKEKLEALLPDSPQQGQDPALVLAQWAADTLKIPSGPRIGQPFVFDRWQTDFLSRALAPGIREAGLSVARKNGKSGLIAALLLGYLCGPLNCPQWRGIVVSLTGALAAELRDAVVQTAEASGLANRLNVRRSPPPGSIDGQRGARLTILASDRATGHAVGADLAVLDEAGLLQETSRELWAAVLSQHQFQGRPDDINQHPGRRPDVRGTEGTGR